MVMKILILIFFEIKESKITRGHNYTLVKKQSRLDARKYSFPRGPSMYGINYQLIEKSIKMYFPRCKL